MHGRSLEIAVLNPDLRAILSDVDGLWVPVIGRRALIVNKRTVARPQDPVDAALLEALE